MPVFDNATIAKIQNANDIVDVVAEHVALIKKGREMVGLCPFHDDHKPSMNVSPQKQIFKCFACGAGGDVFKFIQLRESLSFPQAVQRLAERAQIPLPKPIKTSSHEPRVTGHDINPNLLARVNAFAAKHFAANLAHPQKGKAVRDYLAERKISPESIKQFQLGLALDSRDDFLQAAGKKNIPDKLLTAAGLAAGTPPNLTDRFQNRLIFTICDVTSRVIGFGARTLSGQGAKYINSPATPLFDKSSALYGLNLARHHIVESQTAVVVEGYTDCLIAHQLGIKNVIATLGTSFTTSHARIIRRYANNAVLLFDSDTAGIEAANRALQTALAARIDIKIAAVPACGEPVEPARGEPVVSLPASGGPVEPAGKDPCDFLLAEGKRPFQKLIQNATDVFTFKWNRLAEKFNADQSIPARKQAVDEFLDAVAVALNAGNLPAIETGLIVNRLANIISVHPKDLRAELKTKVNRAKKAAQYDTFTTENQKVTNLDLGRGLAAAAQQEIIEVLLNQPNLFKTVKQNITPETFDAPLLSQIADILFDLLKENPKPALKDILSRTESVELSNAIVHLADVGEQKANYQQRLAAAIDALKHAQKQKTAQNIKTIKDQKHYIQQLTRNTEKTNRHNIGLH